MIVGYGDLGQSILSSAFNYADSITILDHSAELRIKAETEFESLKIINNSKSEVIIRDLSSEIKAGLKTARDFKTKKQEYELKYTKNQLSILKNKIKKIKEDLKQVNEMTEELGELHIEENQVHSYSLIDIDTINIQVESYNKRRSRISELKTHLESKLQMYEAISANINNDTNLSSKITRKLQVKFDKQRVDQLTRQVKVEVYNLIMDDIRENLIVLDRKLTQENEKKIKTKTDSVRKKAELKFIKINQEYLFKRLIYEEFNKEKLLLTKLDVKANYNENDFLNADKLVLTSQATGTMVNIAMLAMRINDNIEIYARAIDTDHKKILNSISNKIIILDPEIEVSQRMTNKMVDYMFKQQAISFDNGQLIFFKGKFNLLSLGRKVLVSYKRPRSILKKILFFLPNSQPRQTLINTARSSNKEDYNLAFVKS